MADPRFFKAAGPFTLDQLAQISGSQPADLDDGARVFVDVAALDAADHTQISFLDNRKYIESFQTSKAGAIIVHPDLADKAPRGAALLLNADAYRAYAKIAQAFYPKPPAQAWISPSAFIDETAQIAAECRIDHNAVIGAGVVMGARCSIGAGAYLGDGVLLGEDCTIGAGATVQYALIGDRVYIYPGARIGQDGFGFAMSAQGHLKVPQLGRVIIGNNVEIGANSTIDRGAGPDTVIGDGCMIDNLVQIGHNVQLGRGCVIVAQAGISGSTKFGDFAAAGGQAGFAGHLKIGMGAKIAAQSGVIRDVGPGETVGGYPAVSRMEWLRQTSILSKMARKKI